MDFSDRIKKSFGLFGRSDKNDKNEKYGLFEIIDDKQKLITSGSKESCESARKNLAKKIPSYVIRKMKNLWSFSAFNVDTTELTCQQVFDSLDWLVKNSDNQKFAKECKKLYDEFDKLCKANHLLNFSEEFDSSEVETKWEPPENLFSEGSAKEIADEVHKSHDSLKSAISCLNFYLNRGGDTIPEDRKKVIEEAKDLVRKEYNKNFSDKSKEVKLEITDLDGEIMGMLEFISNNSLAGHSFDVVVDPGSKDNERTFFIDGDGSDKLKIL